VIQDLGQASRVLKMSTSELGRTWLTQQHHLHSRHAHVCGCCSGHFTQQEWL
jgi:hypothetical protein